MATREELDSRLARYLDREDEDPIRQRMARFVDWQHAHEAAHTELLRVLDSHAYRLGSLEFKASELAKGVEDTGRHYVTELRGKVKRVDDLWWRILLMIIVAIGGSGIGAIVYHLARP
jgi:hypothetical protein